MDTLISKSTFYDAVSMIVPGFVTLFSISKIFGIGQTYFSDTAWAVPYYICIFALSYLVGLLIHRFSQCCFDWWLRNNPKHIKAAKEKFEKEKMGRPNEKVLSIKAKICPSKRNKEEEFYNMHDYYTNYYRTIQNSSIPVMEAQVAFIRSMLVVFVIIIISLAFSFFNMECIIDKIRSCKKVVVMLSLLILGLFLKYLMFHIQKKIYTSVFEDSYYINGLNKKNKKEQLNKL